MSDRDEILANFQACAGIDDFEHSVAILEQHGWDLEQSMNAYFAEEQPPVTPPIGIDPILNHSFPVDATEREVQVEGPHQEQLVDWMMPNVYNGAGMAVGFSDVEVGPVRSRMVHFDVEYVGNIYPVVLPDTASVGTIKDCLATTLGAPKDEMKLLGFKVNCSDTTMLRDLHLPKENHLTMRLVTHAMGASTSANSKNAVPDVTFSLLVKNMMTGKTYPLKMIGSKLIGQVKTDVAGLTGIPVSRQSWIGWPAHVREGQSVCLSESGLEPEMSYFEVSDTKSKDTGARSNCVKMDSDCSAEVTDAGVEPTASASEDEDDELELSEDFAKNVEPATETRSLIPDNVANELEGTTVFREVFRDRYGSEGRIMPPFYVGSLDEAISAVFSVPVKMRRPLFIYLHHDRSIFANIFCDRVLCSSELLAFFHEHDYTIWPWDLTHALNKAKMMTWLTRQLGSLVTAQIQRMQLDQLPVLLVVTKFGGILEAGTIISGSLGKDEVLPRLWESQNSFLDRIAPEIVADKEREARDLVRQEQDEAYQESLAMDREKEKQRREEEAALMEAAKKAQELENMEREQQERRQKAAAALVPPEPPTGQADQTKLRFVLPSGVKKLRRFEAENTLDQLFAYLESEGFMKDQYKLLCSYPRRDLTAHSDLSSTLRDLNLVPNETVILELKE